MTYPTPVFRQALRCFQHPDREGVGVCVGCRAVVCVECSTRIDRMNYCIRCLRAARPAEEAPVSPTREALVGIPLLLAAFAATAVLFTLLGVFLAVARTWSGGGVSAG
jgi:hypothetical protein